MRHFLIVVCFILSFPFFSSAQEFGFKAGLGASRYNFRQVNFPTYVSQFETFKHSPIWSASVGVYSKFDTGKNLNISVGLNYTKKGSREYTVYNTINPQTPDTLYKVTSDMKVHMHYLDLTGLIHIKKLNLFVGGQVSYLSRIDNDSYYNTLATYNGNEVFSDTQESQMKFDFSFGTYNRIEFAGVIGYEHKISEKARLTLSYTQGINGVLSDDFFIQYRNSQLMLGFNYALKTKEKKSK